MRYKQTAARYVADAVTSPPRDFGAAASARCTHVRAVSLNIAGVYQPASLPFPPPPLLLLLLLLLRPL